ncbi:MAG TPA: hypothetical protein VEA69_07485 [Tepidisphaeraceae bacterium]|nr:hypothetical protein [Tepidisphaeraceae bacterium]
MTALDVKYDPGDVSFNRKAYIRFDTWMIASYDAGATATLKLSTNGAGAGHTFDVWAINDLLADSGSGSTFQYGEFWNEGSGLGTNTLETDLHWNNAPANNNTGNTLNAASATLLGAFSIPSAVSTVTFNDPDLLAAFMGDTNKTVTLVIVRTTTASQLPTVAADEHATLLTPTVEFTNVTVAPLPGIALGAIALFGGMGALRPRRNRGRGSVGV